MASITIRNIDHELKVRLRLRVAKQGHSMEEEARIILRRAVNGITGPELLSLLGMSSRLDERETPNFTQVNR